jgi:hypothetical protein
MNFDIGPGFSQAGVDPLSWTPCRLTATESGITLLGRGLRAASRPETGDSRAAGGRTQTRVEVEGDVLKCLGLDIQPRSRAANRRSSFPRGGVKLRAPAASPPLPSGPTHGRDYLQLEPTPSRVDR